VCQLDHVNQTTPVLFLEVEFYVIGAFEILALAVESLFCSGKEEN